MTITTSKAAKKICVLSGWNITNLKLQKILYLSHMAYLGIYEEPLVYESFHAGDCGPVLPSLYNKVIMFGNRKVRDVFYGTEIIKETHEAVFLQYFVPNILDKTETQLVTITERANGAWAKAYMAKADMNCNHIITNDSILKEYIGDLLKQEGEEMNLVKRFFNYCNVLSDIPNFSGDVAVAKAATLSQWQKEKDKMNGRPLVLTGLKTIETFAEWLRNNAQTKEDTRMTKEFSIGVNLDSTESTESPDIYQKAVTEIVKEIRCELDTISGMLMALEVIVKKR